MSDCFASQPDFTPYDALPPDTRVFDPAKVVEPGLEMKARGTPREPFDDPDTIRQRLRERLKEKE